MPKGSLTTLFVSSTCYDLSEIRVDIKEFADLSGLEPVLSELHTFPINPSQTAVNNCLDVVRTRADLFLLVVGNRYGTITEAGKSITNLEYIEAVNKNLPRYVFVKKEILTILPLWKKNPEADFKAYVDTPDLFEFVTTLRDTESVWVFPFETAQDIIKTLKIQLSYLFAESLDLRAKLHKLDVTALSLSPEALRIFVEKPPGWEYLVFAKSIKDKIQNHYQKRLDLELELTFDRLIELEDSEIPSWLNQKINHISQIAQTLAKSLNNGIEKAVGKQGETGDIKRIEHLSSRIAEGYLQAIDWTLDFHRVKVVPDKERLVMLAAKFSSNMLQEIEEYATTMYDKIENAIINHSPGDEIQLTLELTADIEEFDAELKRFIN